VFDVFVALRLGCCFVVCPFELMVDSLSCYCMLGVLEA